jgi:hypothetical protein
MPNKKHLVEWVMSHTDWSQGNNLAETKLLVSQYSGEQGVFISAETLCVNQYGSTFSTERYLDVPCPSCFAHLFRTNQVLVFDI